MTAKRFTVEKLDLVSDHLSTRFFIVDNENMGNYDVQHIVNEGFEVQFGSWAEKIADKLNDLSDENEQLNSIRKFADRNGICIFNIDKAFRRCWRDNAKLVKENEQLKEELDYWKKRALLLEKKYNEGDSIKWLRENTVWEQMPSNKRTFTKTTKSDKND